MHISIYLCSDSSVYQCLHILMHRSVSSAALKAAHPSVHNHTFAPSRIHRSPRSPSLSQKRITICLLPSVSSSLTKHQPHKHTHVCIYIQISVSDPFKQGEGLNTYVSYKVNTRTNLPQFEHGQLAVVRRYRDFVWLRAQMMKAYPGIIVPPLPEKLVVGRFSEDFVEGRRRALER
jgi:hypothetical protein